MLLCICNIVLDEKMCYNSKRIIFHRPFMIARNARKSEVLKFRAITASARIYKEKAQAEKKSDTTGDTI